MAFSGEVKVQAMVACGRYCFTEKELIQHRNNWYQKIARKFAA